MDQRRQVPHDWFPRPIPSNVDIGESSWLYSSFAFLHYRSQRVCGVRIGRNTGIYNGTFFDLDIDGQLTVGDYCTLVGAIFSTNAAFQLAITRSSPMRLRSVIILPPSRLNLENLREAASKTTKSGSERELGSVPAPSCCPALVSVTA